MQFVGPAEAGRPRSDDGGYILVALLVGIAIASVWMSAALPSWRQQVVREREAELIFRGEQYARAIWLYQQKMGGALPTSLDDLVSQKVLRRKWNDPITGDEFLPRVGCQAGLVPGGGSLGGGRAGQTPQPIQQPGQQAPFGARQSQPGQPTPPAGQTLGAVEPLSQRLQELAGQSGQGICGVQSRSTEASIKIYNGQQQYDLWQFDITMAALLFQQNVARLAGAPIPAQFGFPAAAPGQPGRGGVPARGRGRIGPGAGPPVGFPGQRGTPGTGPPGRPGGRVGSGGSGVPAQPPSPGRGGRGS